MYIELIKKIMKKEIEIILQDKSWDKLFNAIFNEKLYDYKKFILKLYIEEETLFNKENIKLGVIFTFKKEKGNFYGKFTFGLHTEIGLTNGTVNEIKKAIDNFVIIFLKTRVNKEKSDLIKIDKYIFDKIGCGSIDIKISNDYENKKNNVDLFKSVLKNIYEFLYFDVLNYSISKLILISPPSLLDIEKTDFDDTTEVDLPYWLRESSVKKVEKSKIDKLFLEDMGGNKDLKIELSKLISFYKNKDHFKKWNIEPPRGVLLYGPPGTGKTLTAKIVANEIGSNFYTLSSNDIISKWVGESAKNIENFFKNLSYPCIVFLDEIDSLVPKRDKESGKELNEENIQTINSLLREIDGFSEKKEILFIGATNRIDAIDPALLRAGRLDYKIFVDYPDFEARKEIWLIYLNKANQKTNFDFFDEKVDLDVLAKKTDKFTGSDISEIVRRLLNDYAIGSLVSEKVSKIIGGETTLKGLLYFIDKYKKEKIINREIVPAVPDVKLTDIGGSKKLKEELEKVINQYRNSELFEELGVNLPRGILLYGPPGTGKTLAAKALAGEIGEIFYTIKASDILSQWTNASVEKLDNIFKSFESPSIVFIDEIDAIAKSRDKNQNINEEDIKVLNAFLQYIDGFSEKRDILFIGATNRIDALDKAILRAGRFDTKIFVDYPDQEAREDIWKIYIDKSKTKTSKLEIFTKDIDYKILSIQSDNFTGADISEIVRRLKEKFAIEQTKNIDIKSKKITFSKNITNHDISKEIEIYKEENNYSNKNKKKIGFNV